MAQFNQALAFTTAEAEPSPQTIQPYAARLAFTFAGGGDVTPPVITLISPPNGTEIQRNTVIVLDVTDEILLRRVALMVTQGPNTSTIHDGDAFRSGFGKVNPLTGQPYSTRDVIAGGFRYTIQRPGGWSIAPLFKTIAIDTSGNEAA